MSTWPPKTNYAAGDILTAAQMNDIGGELNDLYNSYGKAAGKNAVINGGFDIWQRGTSFTGNGYFADRWTNANTFNAVTASRQSSGAPDLSQYYLRLTSTGASSYWSSKQIIETANCAALWGKTVTLSVKLRRNSTFNSTSMTVYLQKSATVDAGVGATWTDIGSRTNVATASIPTGTTSADWVTATVTATVPNDATANSLQVVIEYNGAAQNGSIIEISQVQLELGSSATPFSRAGGTIQGELAACQRYYIRTTSGTSEEPVALAGYAYSTTVCSIPYVSKSSMRTAPNAVDFSNLQVSDNNGAAQNVTNVTISKATSDYINLSATVASGLTANKMYWLTGKNSLVGYVGLSAEL